MSAEPALSAPGALGAPVVRLEGVRKSFGDNLSFPLTRLAAVFEKRLV